MNYLFGAAKLGGNKTSALLTQRQGTIFPESSPEWASIRLAAFIKLM